MQHAADDSRDQRLRRNLSDIRRRMEAAQDRGAHAGADVRLVVVTKSVPPSLYGPLAAAGVTDIGENRVQPAAARKPEAPGSLIWHGIGHIQRNKAAQALETFDLLHAVDSLRLAARLDDLLAGLVEGRGSPDPSSASSGAPYPIYLQVNAARDPDKAGVAPESALEFLREVARLPRLRVKGFMTMGKLAADDADLRSTFRTLREIRDEALRLGLGAEPPGGLSMGMSGDFETAIEEGATVVRIGTAVFAGVSTEESPAHRAGSPPVSGEPT